MDKAESRKISKAEWRKANRDKCRASCQKWRANNPERVKELDAANREKNGDKRRARDRELYAQNAEKMRERKREWARKNPDKVKETKKKTRMVEANRINEREGHRKWLEENKEKVATYNAEYTARPGIKGRMKQTHAEWYKAHPEAGGVYVRNRKARKLNAGGEHNIADIQRLFILQKGKCVVCRTKLTKYHVDHIMPLSLGGGNGPGNLQLLCPSCNLSKHSKHPIDFMQSRGFLL
jgi:hypothetical protein